MHPLAQGILAILRGSALQPCVPSSKSIEASATTEPVTAMWPEPTIGESTGSLISMLGTAIRNWSELIARLPVTSGSGSAYGVPSAMFCPNTVTSALSSWTFAFWVNRPSDRRLNVPDSIPIRILAIVIETANGKFPYLAVSGFGWRYNVVAGSIRGARPLHSFRYFGQSDTSSKRRTTLPVSCNLSLLLSGKLPILPPN